MKGDKGDELGNRIETGKGEVRGVVEQGIQSILRNFLSTNNMNEMGVLSLHLLQCYSVSGHARAGRSLP